MRILANMTNIGKYYENKTYKHMDDTVSHNYTEHRTD